MLGLVISYLIDDNLNQGRFVHPPVGIDDRKEPLEVTDRPERRRDRNVVKNLEPELAGIGLKQKRRFSSSRRIGQSIEQHTTIDKCSGKQWHNYSFCATFQHRRHPVSTV